MNKEELQRALLDARRLLEKANTAHRRGHKRAESFHLRAALHQLIDTVATAVRDNVVRLPARW